MSQVVYQDMIANEMMLKNCLNRRIIDLNDVFDETSVYKLIYMIEKIVELDKFKGIEPKNAEPITIRINSYGGHCYELWSAINVIEHLKEKGYEINTVCMGKAMSCGFVLFCAGVNRSVYKYSTLMYHSVSTGAWGKVKEIEEDLESAKVLNRMSREYVLEKTNITVDKLDEIDKCKIDWYIASNEALELNVATEIL